MRTWGRQGCAAILLSLLALGAAPRAASQLDASSPAPDAAMERNSPKTLASGLYMTGYSAAFGTNYSDVTVTVTQLDNDSYTRTTGTMKIEYWAAIAAPARAASFTGYRLAAFTSIAPLAPRTYYSSLVRNSAMVVPPDGTYTFVLLLLEYDPANCSEPDGYCMVDSLIGSQRTFGAQAATYPLTVTLAGTGTGVVTSSPSGIDCGSTCTAVFSSPAVVTLTPAPSSASAFGGWGGACSGTGSCAVTMTQPAAVTATFNAVAAASTANYSDIWWNPNESGWGLTISDHDAQIFAVWYTYRSDGKPIWYVLTGFSAANGRTLFNGEIWVTTGPQYASVPFNTSQVTATKVGSATLDFAPSGLAPGVATFNYQLNGINQTKQIQRQPFGTASPLWGSDYTDIWWNAAESGWGLTLAQHGGNIFGVLYTYDTNSQPLWVVMPGVGVQGLSRYAGTLYTTTGPAFSSAVFDPNQVRSTAVGNATLSMSSDSGDFSYTINGATILKSIVRQPFGSPTPASNAMDAAFNFTGTYPSLGPVTFTDRTGATATVNAFPGQVSVVVSPATPSTTVASLAQAHGASVVAQIPKLGIYLLSVPAGGEAALIAALLRNAAVIDAFPHVGVDVTQVISGPVVMSIPPATTSTSPLLEAADVIEFDGFDTRSITPAQCSGVRHGDAVGYVLTNTVPGDPAVTVAQYEMRGGGAFEAQNIVHQLARIADGAYRQNTAKIVNMSLGVTGGICTSSPSIAELSQVVFMGQIMAAMNNMNVVQRQQLAVVISLGNCGSNLTPWMSALKTLYPNALASTLFVGGAEQGGTIYNYTTNAEDAIYAPGVAVPVSASGATCSGTSFAAPRAARLVAQLNKLVPNLGGDQLLRAIREAAYADPAGFKRIPSLADALAAAQRLYGGSCIFTYSSWSACVNNVESRTVVVSSPPACLGAPVLTRACSNQCTYSYTDWSACQPNGSQTRQVSSFGPAGCTGTPVLSQSCTYVPPAGAGTCTGVYQNSQLCRSCSSDADCGGNICWTSGPPVPFCH
jgi:Subtilase family